MRRSRRPESGHRPERALVATGSGNGNVPDSGRRDRLLPPNWLIPLGRCALMENQLPTGVGALPNRRAQGISFQRSVALLVRRSIRQQRDIGSQAPHGELVGDDRRRLRRR